MRLNVALVRQQHSQQPRGQTTRCINMQSPEQRPSLGDPAEPLLEHGDGETAGDQVTREQGQQRPLGGDIGPQ